MKLDFERSPTGGSLRRQVASALASLRMGSGTHVAYSNYNYYDSCKHPAVRPEEDVCPWCGPDLPLNRLLLCGLDALVGRFYTL